MSVDNSGKVSMHFTYNLHPAESIDNSVALNSFWADRLRKTETRFPVEYHQFT